MMIQYLDIVRRILIENRFDVMTNSDGYNLPEIVNKYEPNIIILDIRLPAKRAM